MSILKSARRFVIRILQDTEDDLTDETVVPLPDPNAAVTLERIRNNDLYHHALALNALHVRVGRLEAKTGLILAGVLGILGLALRAVVEPLLNLMVQGLF